MGLKIPTDYIICYDFSGNLIDKSLNLNHGIGTGSYSFVTGRKGISNSAISFVNGIVETQSNVDLTNNDKITISFWWKPEVSSNAQCVLSHSDNFDNNNNSFGLTRNWAYQTYISVIDHNGSYNFTQAGFTVAAPYSFSFDHVLITIDRNFGVDEAKLFINNVEFGLAGFGGGYFNDLNGLFSSFKMCIGRRKSNSDLPYVGLMQDFRLYNRILNRQEKMSLYNE